MDYENRGKVVVKSSGLSSMVVIKYRWSNDPFNSWRTVIPNWYLTNNVTKFFLLRSWFIGTGTHNWPAQVVKIFEKYLYEGVYVFGKIIGCALETLLKNEFLHWYYLTTSAGLPYWKLVFCTTIVFVEHLLVVMKTSTRRLI